MPTLLRPSPYRLQRLIERAAEAPFTYPVVGATRGIPPAGYWKSHHRARLGAGESDFHSARRALQAWQQFALNWTELTPPDAPLRPETPVLVLAKVAGLWWPCPSRIIYTVEEMGQGAEMGTFEETHPIFRYGFAYGTLPGHVAAGEERFLVEWDPRTEEVWFEILAFSLVRHPLARLAFPWTRFLQKRFARDAAQAMQRFILRERSLSRPD